MKLCVYAICKNEKQFVDRFMKSIGNKVPVYIGDTGSTDGTQEAFRKYKNVTVFEYTITPWRFDHARQKILDLIGPKYDLYFSLDIDEFIITKNWKKILESKWQKDVNQVYYTFEPYFDANGKPTSTFLNNRMHSFDFKWTYPIHEVITPSNNMVVKAIKVPELVVHHLPDPTKTSTASYLPLLEMAEKEMPDDPRIAHYLGREYMYHDKLEDAIRTLERHISMPNSVWKSERSCSMRLIADCYVRMKQDEYAEFWYMKSIVEAPDHRECWIALSKFYYFRGRWSECFKTAENAYKIKEKTYDHYSSDHYSWVSGPEDLCSVSLYHLGCIPEALKYAEEAYKLDPTIERYRTNVESLREINERIKQKQHTEVII